MKKKTRLVLVAILALTVVIGSTLAYMASSTDPVENKFTLVSGDDITGEIVETWDPDDGKDIIPGAEIEKIVRLKNTSSTELAEEKAQMYGALQIWWDKVDANGDATPMTEDEYAIFESIMELTKLNNTQWTAVQTTPKNGTIYMYTDLIARGQETEPLFEGVKISSDLDNEKVQEILAFAPKGFNIRIEGEIVQGLNITVDEAEEILVGRFNAR